MSTPKFNSNSHLTKLHASVIDFGTRLMHSRQPFHAIINSWAAESNTSCSHLGCDEHELNGRRRIQEYTYPACTLAGTEFALCQSSGNSITFA